jgi:uncharacterized protein with HEPN domain
MPSDKNYGPLRDIQRNIELAQSFISGETYEAFQKDRKAVYAAIRCLEIISEASRRLSADLKDRHPHLPWSDIAAAGNIYRHDYEDVLDQVVWDTVQGLGAIAEVAQMELQRLNP